MLGYVDRIINLDISFYHIIYKQGNKKKILNLPVPGKT